MTNVISLEDRILSRLQQRAEEYLMHVEPVSGGQWALYTFGVRRPECIGTLAELSADLDIIAMQAREPNEDIVIGE